MDIDNIIKYFANLREFSEFVDEIKEAADGEEIARGMNPNDKSKQEKNGQSAPPEGKPPIEAPETDGESEGGPKEEAEPGGAPMESGAGGGEAPVIDPVAAPGSQIAVGKKIESSIHKKPKTKAVEVSGKEKVEINTNPKIKIDPRFI